MNLSHTKKAILALILANILWGATPPIMKWSLTNVHTFTLAFLRYFIPMVILAFFLRKRIAIRLQDAPLLVIASLFGITFNIAFYFIGIHYTESINVNIIASGGPIFLLLGSMFFLKERPVKKVLLGNLLGLGGVLIIILEPLLQKGADGSLYGNFLLLLSALSAVINTIMIRDLARKYHPLTLTFWTFFIGAMSFYPLFIQETAQYGFLPGIQMQGIIGILYGSFFPSLFAWLLFYYALKYALASDTSVFMYIDPIASLIVAIPLLHEYPSALFFVGSFLVFFGIYIAEGRLHWHPIHWLLQSS